VIGSRLMGNGHKIPAYRRFGQKMLNRFTNVGAKEKLTDTQSGFRAMNMQGVRNMDFNSDGYGLESGMIVHFAARGLIDKRRSPSMFVRCSEEHNERTRRHRASA